MRKYIGNYKDNKKSNEIEWINYFSQESEGAMKADNIKHIIQSYEKLPYECILIDGPWGVGKSYAIEEMLDEKGSIYKISMFGMKGAQEIYREVLSQLVAKDEKKGRRILKKTISKAINIGTAISNKMATIRGTIESFVTERELFLLSSEAFQEFHCIVIDDLERMKDSIEIGEVFGIIDELKRCNHVKVILVANTKEIRQKKLFTEYSEKVIDRTYHITERPGKVEWKNLRIHPGFITEFLNKHDVKNLRTLQKAQNFYDDVKLKLQDGYCDEFYDEIRWTCYAIVVESIDNLYSNNAQEQDAEGGTKKDLWADHTDYYLRGARISRNMVQILQKYYANESEIMADEVDAEYEIFIHAGEKANYYKSDDEIKQVLPYFADKMRGEISIAKVASYADEYFIWSEHLKTDNSQLEEEYREKLCSMFYKEAMDGNEKYLLYRTEAFDMQSPTNKRIIGETLKAAKIKVVDGYVEYLSKNTHGRRAYQYSYILRKFADTASIEDVIAGKVDALYNENSFPIHNVTDQQYSTAYNIMYVLYRENKDRFLEYCNEIKTKCDNMAAHRINVLLKHITEENS